MDRPSVAIHSSLAAGPLEKARLALLGLWKEKQLVSRRLLAYDSVRSAEEYLSAMPETFASVSWRLTVRGKELFSKPRIAVLRSIMRNNWYHHCGQLSVYLRCSMYKFQSSTAAVLTRIRSDEAARHRHNRE